MTNAIVYQRRLHTVAEIFFTAEPPTMEVDIVDFIQAPAPVAGARCAEFYTLVLDLRDHEPQLWRGMPKNTRYEVRRADERDAVIYQAIDRSDAGAVGRFLSFYDSFARSKRLPAPDAARLKAQSEVGSLDLSVVRDRDGGELVWHAYYRAHDRVRLLYSASPLPSTTDSALRSLVGRANRYHHWQDVLRFKADGLRVYDFGGWYHGTTDQEKLRINAFKESFGGQIVRDFNCSLPNSPIGRAVLGARRLRTLRRRFSQTAPFRRAAS